jgi:hypothetical protein
MWLFAPGLVRVCEWGLIQAIHWAEFRKPLFAGDLHPASSAANNHKRSFKVVRGPNSSDLSFELYPDESYLAGFVDDAPLFSALGAPPVLL